MKVAIPVAKNILALLAAAAIDAGIQKKKKKIHGSNNFNKFK